MMKTPTPGTPKMNPFGISADKVRARIIELQSDAIWQTAQDRWPQVDRDKTYLMLVEMLFVEVLSPGFEMERIALEPIGNFVMGYGPRADLLAVQRVQ